MVRNDRSAVLYVFDAGDGLRTDAKLGIAARKYLASRGRPQPEGELTVARTERGKPYFRDLPGLYGSASHSGDYFVCAIGDLPVGADIQLCRGTRKETPEETEIRLKRIAERYFSARETAFLQTDTADRFFQLWTARESYVKLTGQGIDGTFAAHCVLPEGRNGIPPIPEAGQTACWQALSAVFRQRKLVKDYTVCVCAWEEFSLETLWLTNKK